MTKKTREFMTGMAIGLLITLLFAVKVMAADITPEEAELIAKTVQAEAGNQNFEGRRLVAATILNRKESPDFPDEVEEILSQENQFTTYGKLDKTEATWQDRLAVKMETESRINDEVIFFRTGHYGCGEPLFQHQDHYFSGLADDDKK